MKRRFLIIVMVAMFALFAAACSCDVQPSPTPGASPSIAPSPSIMPSPSAMPSPDSSPDNSPGTTDGTNGDIPNFSEGTVVQPEDVPDIVKAVKDKYADAEITSITHANYMNKKVYKVILKTKDNAAEEIYIQHDGTILEDENGGGNESPKP